jgi:hypothetical protein
MACCRAGNRFIMGSSLSDASVFRLCPTAILETRGRNQHFRILLRVRGENLDPETSKRKAFSFSGDRYDKVSPATRGHLDYPNRSIYAESAVLPTYGI